MTEKAIAKLAVKATPRILESLGSEELIKPICGVVKTVGCKNQIILREAINALGPAYANISAQYIKTLNETMQIAMQSNCKDYSLIVETVINEPGLGIREKVEYVSRLKKEQHEHTMEMVKTYTEQVCKVVVTGAGTVATLIMASNVPKFSGDVTKMLDSHEKTKRTQIRADVFKDFFKGGKGTKGKD